jgi:DNA-binding beta-propeller fold protein YncE
MSGISSGKNEAHTNELLKARAWEVKESPIELGYKVIPDWGQLPEGWVLGPVAGVDVDSTDQVYVFHRGQDAPPLLCFDSEGKFLFSWTHISFGRPHMVICDTDDKVWLIDDGSHIIYKLSQEGEILFKLGVKDVPGEDGTHFNQPTDIAFNAKGEMYVSDGYGNKRIAKFDSEGRYLLQWGAKGESPGEFALPHAIAVDKEGLIYVADRENWRVQIFQPDGAFVKQWTHIGRPSDLVYVSDGNFYTCDHPNGRVTKVSVTGEVIGFFGEPGNNPGQMSSAHSITYSPNSDVIVGHLDGRVQKFTRR